MGVAEGADHAVEMLRARGFTAVKSSVHVNFGPPGFDKLSACKTVVERAFDLASKLLREFEPPPMDPAIREELAEFVTRRKREGGARTDF